MAAKEFIVAIELGSSKVTGIAGQKNLDGSIQILAVVKEESSAFIRKGVVYNIDKTAQCLTSIIKKLEIQLKTEITQVYVGVGGQSIRSVRNVISKDLPNETIVTQDMVIELMDANRNMTYPDQEILDAAVQEYKVGSQFQIDPVGIQATRLEGNFLNILERKAFYKKLNKCFETAGINVAEMYLAPLALADSVLTEAEKRSGCALVDLGADTTTVSVYSKNILRHLAVIPLGSNNITKDIATLQMEADCNFTVVKPLRPMGNLLTGTLNFAKDKIAARMEQGYADAKAALNGAKETPASSEEMNAILTEKMQRLFPTAALLAGFLREYGNRFAPNVQFPTLGGSVFYDNIFEVEGWRLQQQRTIGMQVHYRFLDANNVRVAWVLQPQQLLDALTDYEALRELKQR